MRSAFLRGRAVLARLPPVDHLMPIHSWSPDDRPRERLRHSGPQALSSRELVAILVGSGHAGASAFDVADALLGNAGGSLRRLAASDPAEIESVPGVGPATAARVQAALELGRRIACCAEGGRGALLRGPADVFALLGSRLRDLRQEEFHVVLVDVRHRVTRDVLISRGTLDASLIHSREVFRPAILERSAGVILVHNHPSGDPTPSSEDERVTRELAEAGRTLGIPILDHVIIGDRRFVSLMEGGLVQPATPSERPGRQGPAD